MPVSGWSGSTSIETGLERAATEIGPEFASLVGDVAIWDTHVEAVRIASAQRPLRYCWVNCTGINLQGAAHEITQDHANGASVTVDGGSTARCYAYPTAEPARLLP